MARVQVLLASVATVGLALVAFCGTADAGAKRRIVYFSQTQGYRHKVGIPLVRKLLKADPRFEVDECTDCTAWTPDKRLSSSTRMAYRISSSDLKLTRLVAI